MSDLLMAEVYPRTEVDEELKEIFRFFCFEKKALGPSIEQKPDGHSVITVGFRSSVDKETIIGKFEKIFPGKVDWR